MDFGRDNNEKELSCKKSFCLLITLFVIFTVNTLCFGATEKAKTPTIFPVNEVILCQDGNWEPLFSYIKKKIDRQFQPEDYLVTEALSAGYGTITLDYNPQGQKTGIQYQIALTNSRVTTISRLGKVPTDPTLPTSLLPSQNKMVLWLDGLPYFQKITTIDFQKQQIQSEDGEVFAPLPCYRNEEGTWMVSARAIADAFLVRPITWIPESQTMVAGQTDGRSNLNTSYQSTFILDMVTKSIQGVRNRVPFTILLEEKEVENRDGTIFASAEKLLEACGIYPEQISWSEDGTCLFVDQTPNAKTDHITLCAAYRYMDLPGNPYFVEITSKEEIEAIQTWLLSDSFRSNSERICLYQGDPDFYLDLNNGTVLRFYGGSNCGYFYDCRYAPQGFTTYLESLFEQMEGENRAMPPVDETGKPIF